MSPEIRVRNPLSKSIDREPRIRTRSIMWRIQQSIKGRWVLGRTSGASVKYSRDRDRHASGQAFDIRLYCTTGATPPTPLALSRSPRRAALRSCRARHNSFRCCRRRACAASLVPSASPASVGTQPSALASKAKRGDRSRQTRTVRHVVQIRPSRVSMSGRTPSLDAKRAGEK